MIFETDSVSPIVFHYNKKHNEDTSVAPWVIKVKGETFYVNHFDIEPGIGFSTKETPDSEHTKAALKVKARIRIYEIENMVYAQAF